jgi:ankyrin repeat protein
MSEPDPGTDACFLAKAAVLNILKFEEIEDRRLNIKASYSKTCIWLLQDPAYLEWLNSDEYHKHRGFFWIKGKPGCGKSTLAKFAYTQLSLLSSAQTPSPSRQDTILSFFFNARGTELERSAAGLYRSLITQLLASCKNDKQLVSTLTCAAFSPTERLIANTDMLKQLLTILLCDVHRSSVVMMIDALDECSEDEIRDMIDFFEELGDRASLDGWEFRVWFSSRHYPHITAKTSVQLVLEDQAGHGHDVERYISGKLKIGRTKQAEAIRQQVHERASGVFLWVVLVVDILNKAFDRGQVRALQAKLQDIPDNLHDLFQDILMRDNLHMAEMRLCFAWLLHAKRPLKPEELFYAILSGSSSDALCPKWDPTEMSLKDITRFILSSSKGLAEITKSKTRNVQFIHESVRDFLLNGPRDHTPGADWSKTFSDTLGQSHNQLKQCCYTYIQGEIRSKASSDFGVEDGNEAQARNIVTDQYPFLDYAVHNVFTHADEAQYHGFDQQAFLAEFELTGWVQLNNTHEEFKVRRIPQDIDLCYLFAEQDLPNLFKAVIAVKPKLSGAAPVYGRYGLPAYAAIACNSHRVFDILLQDKLPAVTAQPLHRNTAESKTSDHKIFSFLMKKTTAIIQKFVLTCTREAVLMRGNNGETLLSWSIQGGHVHLVESLLGHGFDLNVNHGGALVTALDLNHKIIIDMLLERASQLSQATLHNCIDHCVRKGYRSALEKLLQQYTFSARIFVPTNEDTGPILEAAKVGDHLLVKFFLYNNFYFYCSLDGPFIAASERGHMKVVEAFSRHGGGIDALGYDEGGMTALCLAARQNDSETVRLLLSLGADVSRCGWAFLDALSTAAYYGSLDAVQILLVHCSNPNAPEQQRLKSSSIDEALRNASKCAEEHIVALLLQHGANPKATETSSVRNGYTALHFAVMSRERGHIWAGRTTHSQRRRIIQLLLDSGADINARNAYAETILAVAENAHANQEIIALLQSNGAIL